DKKAADKKAADKKAADKKAADKKAADKKAADKKAAKKKPENDIRSAVNDLNDGSVEFTSNRIVVSWHMADSLTVGLARNSARVDTVETLKAIKTSGYLKNHDVDVQIDITADMVTPEGNSSKDPVVSGLYAKSKVLEINYDNVLIKNIWDLTVDPMYIHPEFRE
ncbi:MAG: hypothetical protein L0K44_00270, partial [Yaniella sp.]|nr:hypothetical protein [Yaniella sp.]